MFDWLPSPGRTSEAGIQPSQSATSQVSNAINDHLGGKDTGSCLLHEVQTMVSIRLGPSGITAEEYQHGQCSSHSLQGLVTAELRFCGCTFKCLHQKITVTENVILQRV